MTVLVTVVVRLPSGSETIFASRACLDRFPVAVSPAFSLVELRKRDTGRPMNPTNLSPDRGMLGGLEVLKQEPTFATAVTETDCVAFTLVSMLL